MRIICEKHGCQNPLVVPREVIVDGQVPADINLIVVDFEYLEAIPFSYHLSPTIAARLGFSADTVLPLPDFLPAWTDEIEWWAVCEKCFAESRASA